VIIVIGLVILVAAVVVGLAGVVSNGGSDHALTHGFGAPGGGHHPELSGLRWNRLHLPRHRPEALHAAGTHPPSRDGQPASGPRAHPPVSADSTAYVSQP